MFSALATLAAETSGRDNPTMIRGVHTMFYSTQPEAFREFLRDKLGFPCNDVGDGWLIFDLPEADMGCHPATPGGDPPPGTHAISFYCDDVHKTVAELRRGAWNLTMRSPIAGMDSSRTSRCRGMCRFNCISRCMRRRG